MAGKFDNNSLSAVKLNFSIFTSHVIVRISSSDETSAFLQLNNNQSILFYLLIENF